MQPAATAVSPAFLIDKILPTRTINLISGPSGTGKSTLMLQMLEDWRNGREVFGYKSFPADFHIVSCDRPASHLSRTMQRLGLSPKDFPHFSVVDRIRDRERHGEFSLDELVANARRSSTKLRLLAIDGLAALCPNKVIDHSGVAQFLTNASRLCEQHDFTILGTVYASKTPGATPRESILGCTAWSAYTESKIIIEASAARRTVHLCTSNLPDMQFEMIQDSKTGEFVDGLASMSEELDRWLATCEPGALVTSRQVFEISEHLEISKRTAERWINGQLSLGTLVKVDRGEYRVAQANKN